MIVVQSPSLRSRQHMGLEQQNGRIPRALVRVGRHCTPVSRQSADLASLPDISQCICRCEPTLHAAIPESTACDGCSTWRPCVRPWTRSSLRRASRCCSSSPNRTRSMGRRELGASRHRGLAQQNRAGRCGTPAEHFAHERDRRSMWGRLIPGEPLVDVGAAFVRAHDSLARG